MIITGRGHSNIRSTHPTTIAFTRDKDVTVRGDCFVAVDCDWSVDAGFLEKIRAAKKIIVTIKCGCYTDTIVGHGHPELTLSGKDLVIRKSEWVDSRTLMLGADKSAKDLSKEMVQCLKTSVPVEIRVTV